MRLLYVYIENYKNIKDQEFIFTKEYSFKRDNNSVTITKNENETDFTFGKDLYINAIVGENGAGKSTLMEFIMQRQSIRSENIGKYIIICIEKNALHYDGNITKVYWKNIQQRTILINNNNSIFYSDELAIKSIYTTNNAIDISTSYLLNDSGDPQLLNFDTFQKKELNKQIIFFSQIESLFTNNSFPLKFPSKIRIKVNKEGQIFKEKIKAAIDEIKAKREQKLNELRIEYNNQPIKLSYLESIEKAFNIISDSNSEYFNLSDQNDVKKITKFLTAYKEDPVEVRRQTNDSRYYTPHCEFYWCNEKNEELYLCAGEQKMLGLFARLFAVIDEQTINKSYSVHFLLIDEPELGLHPEWQRQFIHLLTIFCKKLIQNPVQIILTTHSPILLSDIPRDNCIFLKKKEDGNCEVSKIQQQTFGANIHSLYRNSFFLDEKGLMGEYAKRTILELVEWVKPNKIKPKNFTYEKAKRIIEQIGEDVIREQLLISLNKEKDITENDKLKKRIDELEEENKKLKGGAK